MLIYYYSFLFTKTCEYTGVKFIYIAVDLLIVETYLYLYFTCRLRITYFHYHRNGIPKVPGPQHRITDRRSPKYNS